MDDLNLVIFRQIEKHWWTLYSRVEVQLKNQELKWNFRLFLSFISWQCEGLFTSNKWAQVLVFSVNEKSM
jgi:hypothetical protein